LKVGHYLGDTGVAEALLLVVSCPSQVGVRGASPLAPTDDVLEGAISVLTLPPPRGDHRLQMSLAGQYQLGIDGGIVTG